MDSIPANELALRDIRKSGITDFPELFFPAKLPESSLKNGLSMSFWFILK
ncbi:hypothetical protein LBBP_01267 [Leptospira borgpetersenii serovar Ballum]|uniref:Uncharacterized protein n=1 Tax=Leptospira borgpetersenii serovar Ballum TaxID=280505 RepID=A0A0S2IPG7_LEPBO|nr:hypothetical protein LBBP_01267 [Leptospira borgpetersenii serovar Ballum]